MCSVAEIGIIIGIPTRLISCFDSIKQVLLLRLEIQIRVEGSPTLSINFKEGNVGICASSWLMTVDKESGMEVPRKEAVPHGLSSDDGMTVCLMSSRGNCSLKRSHSRETYQRLDHPKQTLAKRAAPRLHRDCSPPK